MDKIKKVLNDLINRIDDIYTNIAMCNTESGYVLLADTIPLINSVFAEFISFVPRFKELGIDIPTEVVLQQLKNLVEAYEYKDSMLLADTLQYEIRDTLILYLEIILEMEKENIVLK